ncbi:MAG: pyridoxamine 5'-phosphate oxidase family protein, partial [Acidimicrobiia bacterium]|nr:pyridoxamine 5'-phosphate oxidase family protein [Acidimicrobiia bacterium]
MGLGDEKYLRLTTFKRDGSAVVTPVWAVALDTGEVGFWTSSGSGKAKRLGHTSKVLVQASDARGRPKPDSVEIEAAARLISAGAEMDEIRRKVRQ